jgi:SAM-dependent methyltransferase
VEASGLLMIDRRLLAVPLPPDIRRSALAHFGDFSILNNRWNSSLSNTTHQRLEIDPTEWYLYHSLYREARASWPEVPVDRIAAQLRGRPDWIIGDFGCGECLLGKALGRPVVGLDHVAVDSTVQVCDMAHTSLADGSLDAAVFSLSLMGANWRDYLQEAQRVLKPYGHLFIAEPQRR